MALKVRLESPKANLKAYKAKIKKIMKEENEEAVKKWLKKVLSLTPTYTGTARGTYAPVGKTVGRIVRKGKVKGNAERARRKKHFVTKSGRRYLLGFRAGARYQDHKIRNIVRTNSITAIFVFDQSLPYVLWNEVSPAGSNSDDPIPATQVIPSVPPWKALEKAAISFNNHFRRVTFKRLGATKLVIGNKVVKSA
jgi:hypothetical protein